MNPVARPVRVAILGAGARGSEAYGRWFLDHPQHSRIVAVADAVEHRRDVLAQRASLGEEDRFEHWSTLLAQAERLELDAVVIALPDAEHVEPALAAAERGLAILLEKPIAPTAATLHELEQHLRDLEPRIAVAHVLRATPFWRDVKDIVSTGLLGELATIRHEENIGFWHFAHSYVRGNWRRGDTSSPMVLAKTSHDLDLIRWLAAEAPATVSSTGSLLHFHAGNAPEGAPSHCIHGCPVADTCPFYAPRYYIEALSDVEGWPVALLGQDVSPEGRAMALSEGPYGRCVYRSDNDVVDHQQTLLTFDSGLAATLTTSAFTGANTRTFQITGTRGELSGRMDTGDLRLHSFSPRPMAPDLLPGDVTVSSSGPLDHPVYEWRVLPRHDEEGDHRGHGGGDDALAASFIAGVASGDFDAHVTTTLAASLDSHWMAFAAERARREGRTLRFADVRS